MHFCLTSSCRQLQTWNIQSQASSSAGCATPPAKENQTSTNKQTRTWKIYDLENVHEKSTWSPCGTVLDLTNPHTDHRRWREPPLRKCAWHPNQRQWRARRAFLELFFYVQLLLKKNNKRWPGLATFSHSQLFSSYRWKTTRYRFISQAWCTHKGCGDIITQRSMQSLHCGLVVRIPHPNNTAIIHPRWT